MPKIKIVMYRDKVKLYLDGSEIPLWRLPDLVPIYIDTVNPDSHGAVVLEGEAWYGIEDEFLPSMAERQRLREIKTRNIVVRDSGKRVELEIRYKGNLYRLRYNKNSLPSAFTPQLISLRVMGRLDNEFISFLFNEFRNEELRKFIRELIRKENQ